MNHQTLHRFCTTKRVSVPHPGFSGGVHPPGDLARRWARWCDPLTSGAGWSDWCHGVRWGGKVGLWINGNPSLIHSSINIHLSSFSSYLPSSKLMSCSFQNQVHCGDRRMMLLSIHARQLGYHVAQWSAIAGSKKSHVAWSIDVFCCPVCHSHHDSCDSISFCYYYCWWKKSCTTWEVQNPANNGINYQPQLVSRISTINRIDWVSPMNSFGLGEILRLRTLHHARRIEQSLLCYDRSSWLEDDSKKTGRFLGAHSYKDATQ